MPRRRFTAQTSLATCTLCLAAACGEPDPTADPSPGDRARIVMPDAGGPDSGPSIPGDAVNVGLLSQSYTRYLGVGEQPIVFDWPSTVSGAVEILEVPTGLYQMDGVPLAAGSRVGTDELQAALYLVDSREEGSAGALRLSYLTPDGTPIEMTVAVELEVHPCDELAATPLDPDRYAEGTYLLDAQGAGQPNVLDPQAALPECERAHTDFPAVPRFMLQLGRCHWRLGDYGRAFALGQQAMDLGSVMGISAVGAHYRDGLGVVQDLDRGFQLISTAAAMGMPGAQHDLAKMLRDGIGTPQDEGASIVPFTQAAEYGFHWAQLNLGKAYRDGRGTAQDWSQARRWFERAADQHNGHAYHELGVIYLRGEGVPADPPRAEAYLLQAAEFALHWTLHELGLLYRDGAPGIDADRDKAIDYLMRAAAGGSAAAQRALDAL